MKKLIVIFVVGVLLASTVGCASPTSTSDDQDIKVGFLIALSGVGAIFGPPTVNCATLAVEEINNAGGINGRKLELVVADTATDPQIANEQAKVLLEQNKVDAIFMMLTSADRNALLPVIENSDKLFFYNVIYEGGATSRNNNLFVNGEVPAQQVTPVLPYIVEEYDLKNWYIVGNDYVWATETSKYVAEAVESSGGKIVGEDYVPMGTTEFSSVIAKIQNLKPDAISAQVVGGDAIAFMKQLQAAGLEKSAKIVAYNWDEGSFAAMDGAGEGVMVPAAYFVDLPSQENEEFLAKYYQRFGNDADTPHFLAVPSYEAIHLWALAANKAGSVNSDKVKEHIFDVSFLGPRGSTSYESETYHANLPIYLVEAQADSSTRLIKEFK